SLTGWLNAQRIATVRGGPWLSQTLHEMLPSQRLIGLRVHRGEIVGKAAWPAILTEQQHERILAGMAQAKLTRQRVPRRYLLSGLLRCGRCGHTLFSAARKTERRYLCLSGPDHGGCGRLAVVADPLEAHIAEAVLFRLDTPELAAALEGRTSGDEKLLRIGQDLADDRAMLDDLAASFGRREITTREWAAARQPIEARIHQAETFLARSTRNDALTGVVGQGKTLRAAWNTLNLTRQNAIVRAVLDHADVGPGTPGVHSFDPARVSPVWRL
ncbi:MAG TPA: recombinase zinc beta ribbon domain-containing protein, partial [Acidimicrobiales bacterium]|nr:recombinase zinc beta ribbon domain-containing protein [Acidimicrobiales bacterium]